MSEEILVENTHNQNAVAYSSVKTEISFIDPIKSLESKLTKRGRKKRFHLSARPILVRIDNGDFGVITEGRSLVDRDGLEEVYTEGEVVILNEYDIDDNIEITQLKMEPGFIRINSQQEVVGLSLDQNDLATFEIVLQIYLENPQKLLTFVADHRHKDANEVLKSKVDDFIRGKVEELLHGDLHLWSTPDFREVADVFASQLDRLLSLYGLRIEGEYSDRPSVKSVYAKRGYPKALPDLLMEYKIAEGYLINQLENNPAGISVLGLTYQDISDVRTFSKHRGEGSGFFELSTRYPDRVRAYIEWLSGMSSPPFAVIRFLKVLAEKGSALGGFELSKQIIFSAFHYPILGIGEWANSEYDVENSTLLKMMMKVELGHEENAQ